MSGIYIEENRRYQIDLRAALWSTDNLRDIYSSIGNTLSDVDFVAETDDSIFLIEYKNTEIENAINPKAFEEKVENGKLYDNIVNKYYGGTFYLLACDKKKPIHFIAILESKLMEDGFTRRRAEASIKKRLPFKLQENPDIINALIKDFKILSISEWNTQFPMFPFAKYDLEPSEQSQ